MTEELNEAQHIEKGVVQSAKGRRATVAIARTSRCGGCKGCLLSGDGKYMVADVYNPIGAGTGATVEMVSASFSQLGAAFLLFVLPIILFIGAFFSIPQGIQVLPHLFISVLIGGSPYFVYYFWPKKFNMYISRIL